MKKTITILVLILTLTSCKNSTSNEKDKIKIANWLLGKWESKIDEGTLCETWEFLNDSTFQAKSLFIKNKDTLHFETITLQQNGEELFYNATVKGQNNDKSVPFKLTIATEKQLVFENPKHDYPQKITYTLITKDSLVTEIYGIELGKPSSEKFGMKKTE